MFESVNIFIVSIAVVVLASVVLLFFLMKTKSQARNSVSDDKAETTTNASYEPDAATKASEHDASGVSASEEPVNVATKDVADEAVAQGVEKRHRPDTGGLPYVLVAEDNISNYKLIEVFLRNVAVTENAVNGKKAVERVKEMDYDVVLMDIKMPVMNGLEATKAIRQFDKNIPIVAVTANVLDFDRKTALANGCNEFVTKPVVRSQLIAVVETYKRK